MPEETTGASVQPKLGATLRTTRDLTAAQRRLVQIMSESQFGRIEDLAIRAGQPVFDPGFKVVRVARLGGDGERMGPLPTDDFELKQAIHDLFDELARLGDGVILRLEFRRGLPCLLEITAATIGGGSPAGSARSNGFDPEWDGS
jgi:hypothetical protein